MYLAPGAAASRLNSHFFEQGALVSERQNEPGGEEERLVEELSVSQHWMRRLVDSDVIGMMVSQEGTIVEANDAFLKIVGRSRDELIAGRLRWREMTPPEWTEADEHARTEILRHGGCPPFEKEYLRPDGTRVPVLLGAASLTRTPLRSVCFVLDLTERKALESRARQAQRIESVVQLAGGIAHDFNNLLTTIIGSSEILLDEGALGEEQREDVEQIRKAASRAAQLTHQLLAFSQRQVLQPRVLDLNVVIGDLRSIARRLLGTGLELVTHLEPALEPVLADLGQLEQILVDLVLRARDAMPAGGRLAFTTANVRVDEAMVRRLPGLRPGRYVSLAVRDDGTGIDRSALDRIFEPFASGTAQGDQGLGLASLYGVVKQSGGHVDVASPPGQGTTFTIYLPAVDRPVREADPAAASDENQGHQTILLVEDEDQVRKLARRILERYGYTVVTASDGAAAIALANRHAGTIHLLLVDMMLPGSSGRELAAELAIHRPAIKVIYLSGTTDDAIDRHRVLAPGTEFLRKPFTLDQLVGTVRKVLDAPPARS